MLGFCATVLNLDIGGCFFGNESVGPCSTSLGGNIDTEFSLLLCDRRRGVKGELLLAPVVLCGDPGCFDEKPFGDEDVAFAPDLDKARRGEAGLVTEGIGALLMKGVEWLAKSS